MVGMAPSDSVLYMLYIYIHIYIHTYIYVFLFQSYFLN